MEQGEAFRLSRGYEAGSGVVQCLIDVSGMADDLPGAGGHIAQQTQHIGRVECPGGEYAQGSIRRAQPGSVHSPQELLAEEAQCADLQATCPRSLLGEAKRPVWFEGVADGRHVASARG